MLDTTRPPRPAAALAPRPEVLGRSPSLEGRGPDATPGKFPADDPGIDDPGIVMDLTRLPALSNYGLVLLRSTLDREIGRRIDDRRRQLAAIETTRGGRPARNPASPLRGVKVPPKYRGPNGETWAGRGAHPKWLASLLAEGRSLDEFLITPEAR